MVEENEIAKNKTGDFIINDTIEDTHETYNTNMVKCINNVGKDGMALFGSHNEDTVFLGMNTINDLGYDEETKNRIIFGQLYGFGDQLSVHIQKQVVLHYCRDSGWSSTFHMVRRTSCSPIS